MVGLYFKQHDKSEKGGGRRGSTGACGCGLPLRMAKTGWGKSRVGLESLSLRFDTGTTH